MEITISIENIPDSIKGCCVRIDNENYAILINSSLDQEEKRTVLEHELKHIRENDFQYESISADTLEVIRHHEEKRKGLELPPSRPKPNQTTKQLNTSTK